MSTNSTSSAGISSSQILAYNLFPDTGQLGTVAPPTNNPVTLQKQGATLGDLVLQGSQQNFASTDGILADQVSGQVSIYETGQASSMLSLTTLVAAITGGVTDANGLVNSSTSFVSSGYAASAYQAASGGSGSSSSGSFSV